MQYMILMGYKIEGVPPITTWAPEDIDRHMAFQESLGRELQESGELAGANGLAWPDEAKIVVSDGTSAPVVTDGPFPESKEFLAGYWMIDVEDEARAIELASQVVVWAERVELREVPDAPPEQ